MMHWARENASTESVMNYKCMRFVRYLQIGKNIMTAGREEVKVIEHDTRQRRGDWWRSCILRYNNIT